MYGRRYVHGQGKLSSDGGMSKETTSGIGNWEVGAFQDCEKKTKIGASFITCADKRSLCAKQLYGPTGAVEKLFSQKQTPITFS